MRAVVFCILLVLFIRSLLSDPMATMRVVLVVPSTELKGKYTMFKFGKKANEDGVNKAKRSYEEISDIIKTVCEKYSEIDEDSTYSLPVMKRRFDYILQCILFKVALSDGIYHEKEHAFIKEIAQYGDILYFVRDNSDVDINWDDLKKLEEDELKKVSEIFTDMTDDSAFKFVWPFYWVQKVLNDSMHIEQVDSNIDEIVKTLANIDGSENPNEIETAEREKNHLLLDNWNLLAKKAEDERRDENERTSKDLKSYFKDTVLLEEGEYHPLNLEHVEKWIKKKLVINNGEESRGDYFQNRSKFFSALLYIEVYEGGQCISSGSGFIVTEDGYALTCGHVVEDAEEIYVKLKTEDNDVRICRAEYVYCSEDLDMAIIKLEEGKYNYIAVDLVRKLPEIGEEILVFGFPMGDILCDDVYHLECSLTKGYVSSRQIKWRHHVIFLDVDARHGNSGGPIVSEQTGKVIGMLHGGLPGRVYSKNDNDLDEINYTIPITYLKNYFSE